MGVKYRGRHSDEFGLAVKTNPSFLPEIYLKTIGIPNMPGVLFQGSQYGARYIPLEISFEGKDLNDYESRLRTLANWLSPEDGIGEYISDWEPDKVYYAVLDSQDIKRVDNIARAGSGTLTLVCPDPFAYDLNELTVSIPAVVNNTGTADVSPKFKITLNQPTTHLEIINNSVLTPQGTPRSIVLGKASTIEQSEYTREELVLDDTMQDTSTWQTAGSVENGYVSGNMNVNANGFYAETFGTPISPNRFQGPSLKKAIGQVLQDFKIDVYFSLLNSNHEIGIIETYLLGSNDEVIGKISFGDPWKYTKQNQGKMQAGTAANGYDLVTTSDRPYGWNDFSGIMRITREDNVWVPYWAIIRSDGTHDWRRSNLSYVDIDRKYTGQISSVQVAIRTWPYADPCDMSIHHIKVYKINQPTDINNNIPYIASAGDIIELNTATGLLTKNGEPSLELISLDTDFNFNLQMGENDIEVNPSGVSTNECIYTTRYK